MFKDTFFRSRNVGVRSPTPDCAELLRVSDTSNVRYLELSEFKNRGDSRNKRLADALDQWSFTSLQKPLGARAYYDEFLQQQQSHRKAARSVANRCFRILHTWFERGCLGDEEIAGQSPRTSSLDICKQCVTLRFQGRPPAVSGAIALVAISAAGTLQQDFWDPVVLLTTGVGMTSFFMKTSALPLPPSRLIRTSRP
jgi:hypothetical protein